VPRASRPGAFCQTSPGPQADPSRAKPPFGADSQDTLFFVPLSSFFHLIFEKKFRPGNASFRLPAGLPGGLPQFAGFFTFCQGGVNKKFSQGVTFRE
jgi:hypothetical protein